MKRIFICLSLLLCLGTVMPSYSLASGAGGRGTSLTMSRAELGLVLDECVKVYCMTLNNLYVAYSIGDLSIDKVQTGVFRVELSGGGGSILILLEDA